MANPVEDLKKQCDGLDVYQHMLEASKVGYEAVDQNLITLFKWYGVYEQKPKKCGYFMMRVKIPGGKLNYKQVLKIYEIGAKYAKGVIDVTTRQAIQMHWLKIEDIPTIIAEFLSVGMDVAGGCGDITRNITGCPLAGLSVDEHFDASEELIAVDQFFNRNKEFSNLPRKYKLSITGCKSWCSQPDINCASLVGVKHPKTGEAGYTLKVGGGLSTQPFIASNFPIFIKRSQALDLMRAVTIVYRDHGFRDKRAKARIKFLIAEWGVDKYLEHIETILGYKLERVAEIKTMKTGAKEYFPSPDCSHHDHLGVSKLKDGSYSVGIALTSGRTYNKDLLNIAELMQKYAPNSELRTTNKQNFIIVGVPETNLKALITEANIMGFNVEHSSFKRLGVACTGTEFCNLAIVETKERAKELFDYLDTKYPNFQDQIMISVTGCPNNCAQYAVADIGLVGCKVRDEQDQMHDGFRIFLGGRLGNEAQFGKALDGRFLHKDIHQSLSKIFDYYLSKRNSNEEFRFFVDRVSLESFQKVLAEK